MTPEDRKELKDYLDERFDALERVTFDKAVALATSPTKNGANIQVLETKIDLQTDLIAGQTKLLEAYFGPDGICPRERSASAACASSVRTHIKGLWTVVSLIALTIIGIVVDIVKGAIGK
jgi:hypothetical protein